MKKIKIINLSFWILLLIMIKGIFSISLAQNWSNWETMVDNQKNGFLGRQYLAENKYENSGYTTHFEIKNQYPVLVFFKVTFNYAEGGSDTWDWSLHSLSSKEWNLDTKRVISYRIRIYKFKDENGKYHDVKE